MLDETHLVKSELKDLRRFSNQQNMELSECVWIYTSGTDYPRR